ncbi:MAG: hypothetical protein AAGF12_23940 [Myxococcota bacterium]
MTSAKNETSLRHDEGGAMMIMSIFMAMLVVGMLYYVAGIGETIVYRERVQDAADSVAMTGAVVLARSMNVIVLLNLVIASVFAAAIITKTVFLAFLLGSGFAAARCRWYRPLPCIAAVCLLFDACDADRDNDTAVDIAERVSDAANDASTAIKNRAFFAAGGGGVETIRHFPEIQIGTGLGSDGLFTELPVADDSDRDGICRQATGFPDWRGSGLAAWGVEAVATLQRATSEASCTWAGSRRYAREGAIAASALIPFVICPWSHREVDPLPQKVTNGVQLGDDEFQFRAGVMANSDEMPFDSNDERVSIALWETTAEDVNDPLQIRTFAQFGLAQSEFYYDEETDRDEWMWDMKWRARLRRFNLGGSGGGGGICGFASGICGVIDQFIVH